MRGTSSVDVQPVDPVRIAWARGCEICSSAGTRIYGPAWLAGSTRGDTAAESRRDISCAAGGRSADTGLHRETRSLSRTLRCSWLTRMTVLSGPTRANSLTIVQRMQPPIRHGPGLFSGLRKGSRGNPADLGGKHRGHRDPVVDRVRTSVEQIADIVGSVR